MAPSLVRSGQGNHRNHGWVVSPDINDVVTAGIKDVESSLSRRDKPAICSVGSKAD